eukprot:2218254-Amphidinium_carterae.1
MGAGIGGLDPTMLQAPTQQEFDSSWAGTLLSATVPASGCSMIAGKVYGLMRESPPGAGTQGWR